MKNKDTKRRSAFGAFLLIALLVVSGLFSSQLFPEQLSRITVSLKNSAFEFAAVILTRNVRTLADIRSHYVFGKSRNAGTKKVRILLVPGHEPQFGGSEYAGLKERDMTLILSDALKTYLEADPHYQVFVTRDTHGWTPEFAAYFKDNWQTITEWMNASRDAFYQLLLFGYMPQAPETIVHNKAPEDVRIRLGGITKWANENAIDITVHIHFNDNPRKDITHPGKYSGLVIYVPATHYGNSTTTSAIATSVLSRLERSYPVSNMPAENEGMVYEPELIAVGSNNTADAASMLIEYSYIYETQFQDSALQALVLKDMAFQTYRGLEDFFNSAKTKTVLADDTFSPYTWKDSAVATSSNPVDIFMLQTALMRAGVYPPNGKTKNECPRTGVMGPCTFVSLQEFQRRQGIGGEEGVAGAKTLRALEE